MQSCSRCDTCAPIQLPPFVQAVAAVDGGLLGGQNNNPTLAALRVPQDQARGQQRAPGQRVVGGPEEDMLRQTQGLPSGGLFGLGTQGLPVNGGETQGGYAGGAHGFTNGAQDSFEGWGNGLFNPGVQSGLTMRGEQNVFDGGAQYGPALAGPYQFGGLGPSQQGFFHGGGVGPGAQPRETHPVYHAPEAPGQPVQFARAQSVALPLSNPPPRTMSQDALMAHVQGQNAPPPPPPEVAAMMAHFQSQENQRSTASQGGREAEDAPAARKGRTKAAIAAALAAAKAKKGVKAKGPAGAAKKRKVGGDGSGGKGGRDKKGGKSAAGRQQRNAGLPPRYTEDLGDLPQNKKPRSAAEAAAARPLGGQLPVRVNVPTEPTTKAAKR